MTKEKSLIFIFGIKSSNNLMKQKAKIIIAREGLIIISLLLLAGISFWLNEYVNGQKRTYESNVQEIEPLRLVTDPDILRQLNGNSAAGGGIVDPFDNAAPAKAGPWEDYKAAPAPAAGAKLPDGFVLDQPAKAAPGESNAPTTDAAPTKPHQGHTYEGGIVILRFPKNTKNEIIKQTIERDFPKIQGNGNWIIWDTQKGENIAASYDEKGQKLFDGILYKINFAYVGLFFLICAYPIYLLGRFIVWAVWTLKENV